MTPFEELNDVLSTFLSLVRAELDDNFIGLYLQGSFAVGDADEFCDCDWIVVVRESIADSSRLQRMHQRIFEFASPWAQHLEGSCFPAAALRARLPDAEPLLYLDNGSRVLERSMAGRAQAYADPHQPADPVELAETLEFVRFVLRLAACES